MSIVGSGGRYVRATEVVWRDTGDHVVAKRLGAGTTCVLIGGSAAQVWRLLERPSDAREILDEVVGREAQPVAEVDEGAVQQVLADLAAHRLVERWDAHDE